MRANRQLPALSAATPAAVLVAEQAGTLPLPVAPANPGTLSLAAPIQPGTAAGSCEIIALIDDHDYARALAMIEASADVAATADGSTPLTALELDNPPATSVTRTHIA